MYISKISFSLLFLFSTLFLFQCNFSIFSFENEINDDVGKAGDIISWINIARSYYISENLENLENSQKVLDNLLKYRWNDMTTKQKIEVIILFSTVISNKYIKDKYLFLLEVETLTESFNDKELSFEKINTNFIDNHINVADHIHSYGLPVLTRIISFSNDITSDDSIAVNIHLGSALSISYVYLEKGTLSSAKGKVGPLKFAYSELKTQAIETKKAESIHKSDPTDKVKSNDFVDAANSYCSIYLKEATNKENDLGADFSIINNFIDNYAIPDIKVLKVLNTNKSAYFKKLNDHLDVIKENFDEFSQGKSNSSDAKNQCENEYLF